MSIVSSTLGRCPTAELRLQPFWILRQGLTKFPGLALNSILLPLHPVVGVAGAHYQAQ